MVKRLLIYAVVSLLAVSGLQGAELEIRGQITNGTTGSKGAAEEVVLYRLDQGMDEVARIADIRGSFVLRVEAPPTAVPHLLQAVYKGVAYNTQLSLGGSNRETDITIPVYETSKLPANLSFRIPHLFIQRNDTLLTHRLLIEVSNRSNPPVTWYDPEGTFQFAAGDGVIGDISVSVSTGAMPVPVVPAETGQKNIYSIDHAIKPGSTNISISYSTGYPEGKYHLSMPALYPFTEINLFIAPPDIAVSAPRFLRQEMEEAQGFAYYLAADMEKGQVIDADLAGGSAGGTPQSAEKERSVSERDPSINAYSFPLILTFAAIFVFGSILLLQWEKSKRQDVREREAFRRSLAERRDRMIAGIAELDRKNSGNAVAAGDYHRMRAELKERLIAILEQLESSQKAKT